MAEANGEAAGGALHLLKKVSKKAWAVVGVVVLIACLVSVAAVVMAQDDSQPPPQSTPVTQSAQVATSSPVERCRTSSATGCQANQAAGSFDPSNGQCQGTGVVQFTSPPLPLDQIGLVEPMGQMIGGHVTPIDHGYIFGIHGHSGSTTNEYPVLAPADGLIVSMTATGRSGQENFVDHAITFSFTCTLSAHYLNMDSFDDGILSQTGEVTQDKPWGGAIPVKAGEVIGHTGPHGIDIFVWNADLTLSGFVKPDQYTAGESWKVHSADPYEYFAEPVKSQLLARDPRVASPRGGKIDCDVDGQLVGNWFKEGSGGYTGGGQMGEGYWKGHLSIVPDAYDPSGIQVSIGDWNGEAKQFGVRGGAPDPSTISTASGLVKYELGMTSWVVASTGERWDNDSYQGPVRFVPTDSIQGVLLVQMVEARRIKIEAFPGQTAAQVTGFDAGAVFYER